MDLLDLIATTLLKYETITKEQIEYLVEHGHMKEEETTTEEKAEVKEESKTEEVVETEENEEIK